MTGFAGGRYVPLKSATKFGGMSQTVVCEDTHLNRRVLVKSLQAATDAARLEDEINAIAAVRSDHVVQIYDVLRCESGAIQALVEEFLPGDELADLPPPDNAIRFLALVHQLAVGIADIHASGVIHRDIKPHNARYDSEGCLKIFDFGLAKIGAPASTLSVIGTKGFMAPELWEPNANGVVPLSEAADVFAFGATALWLAKRKLPTGLTSGPPNVKGLHGIFAELGFSLPSDVAEALGTTLAGAPEQRPTMRELEALIRRHLLRDRHRAVLVAEGKQYVLSAQNTSVQIKARGAAMRIQYDGVRFFVTEVAGPVLVNNFSIEPGYEIRGSCVLVFGDKDSGSQRLSVAMDVSHPSLSH